MATRRSTRLKPKTVETSEITLPPAKRKSYCEDDSEGEMKEISSESGTESSYFGRKVTSRSGKKKSYREGDSEDEIKEISEESETESEAESYFKRKVTSRSSKRISRSANKSEDEAEKGTANESETESSYFNKNYDIETFNDLMSGKTTCNLSDVDSDDSGSTDSDNGSKSFKKSKPVSSSTKPNATDAPNLPNIENSENESGFHEENTVSEYYDFAPLLASQKEQDDTVTTDATVVHADSPEKPVRTKDRPAVKSVGDDSVDVCQLLSLGENAKLSATDIKSSISESKTDDKYEIPKQVEVFVNVPAGMKDKKETDLERALKRKLNSVKQEIQVSVHKVSVLGWIAHGNYVNHVLNSTDILGVALSLLPSDKCYPKKYADLKYLEDMLNWFVGKVKLIKEEDEDATKKDSSSGPLNDDLPTILKRNFELLVARNRTDLVLMFICVLRAVGIKARLLINLNVSPLKLSKGDLLPVCASSSTDTGQKNEMKVTKNGNDGRTDNNNDRTGNNDNRTENNDNRMGKKGEKSKREKVAIKDKKDAKKIKTEPDKSNPETASLVDGESKYFNRTERSHNVGIKREPNSVDDGRERKSRYFERNNVTAKSTAFDDDSTKSGNNKARQSAERCDKATMQNSKKALKKVKIETNEESAGKMNLRSRRRPISKTVVKIASVSDDISDSEEEYKSGKKRLPSRRSVKSESRESSSAVNSAARDGHKSRSSSSTKKTPSKSKRGKRLANERERDNSSSSDSDFELVASTSKEAGIDRRVLSSDDDEAAGVSSKKGNVRKKSTKNENYWTEVYLEAEESWISVDVAKARYHCVEDLYNNASHPVRYVLAWNPDQTIKDVTRRYDPHWLTQTKKLRAKPDWFAETLFPYGTANTPQDREENEELDKKDKEQPLPTSISELKNHPLYVLQRHLLKFEALYPPDIKAVGYVRGEAVYPRFALHRLYGREMWIKEAKVVRLGEKPYKIVKGRQKKKLFSTDEPERKDIELFGIWQVDDYVPPIAKDGIVPRNAYGNVDLFKDCMLPKGTAHLKLPGLIRTANKLSIDCVAAVVGFEFSNGFSYPVKDGFVVCEEYVDTLVDAWNAEVIEEEEKRKRASRERALKLWRKAFKLIRIQRKLKRKYNFNLESVQQSETKSKRTIPKQKK